MHSLSHFKTINNVCLTTSLFSVFLQDPEVALPVRQQSKAWCWCVCLGLALMLFGVVVGGAYLYRYYIPEVRLDHSGPSVYLGVIEYCNWQDWNVVFIVFEYMICL